MENLTKRLSLAELKEKANTIEKSEALESVQGGNALGDCHGWWGQAGKYLQKCINAPDIHPMNW